MLTEQDNDASPFPDWLSSPGLGFWEPDRLYVEWISFLYAIWERVDYL